MTAIVDVPLAVPEGRRSDGFEVAGERLIERTSLIGAPGTEKLRAGRDVWMWDAPTQMVPETPFYPLTGDRPRTTQVVSPASADETSIVWPL